MAQAPPAATPTQPGQGLWTIPNLLTLLRIVLSVVLFILIGLEQWLASLIVFAVAAITDWLDGFIARGYGQGSSLGRNLDPLADKILILGAYIFLLPVEGSGLAAWMVVVVVLRELIVTGARSFLEGQNVKFGADWFGKLKMVLQCVALIVMLAFLWMESPDWLKLPRDVILYLMVAATALSGLQYLIKFRSEMRRAVGSTA
ncbi:MAG: CDP-diacylglycerol--glycerol-3-phosphate 3-phosphatidyltransferase [Gemmatales bacterium]|nr:CDP-diacylglycerol--glycerol-3-phosphate 3-phosphatidyltransferase [Gemmatales bacterium]MDW8387706.1 CDP-diacylglycerol--glycerol-3-phosphate 3-phosphatidyltransferase [Gemmatales bacterium]